MSKQSRRDLREKKERESSERELRITTAVQNWLLKFDAYFPQRVEPLTEVTIGLYVAGLRHLSPYQLDMACEQSLKSYKFSPTIAEILAALKEWQDAQPQVGTYQPYREPQIHFPGEKEEFERGVQIAMAKIPKEEKDRLITAWEKRWARLCSGKPLEGTEAIDLATVIRRVGQMSSEPMPGMRWNAEDNAEDELQYGKNRRENGWRLREESWRRELERDARATKPVGWHAPIVFAPREPGED